MTYDAGIKELRGQDFIPVGPRFGQLSLAELRTIRPEAEAHIRLAEIACQVGVGPPEWPWRLKNWML